MNYNKLKLFAILLPTFLIGGFEFIRHEFLLSYLSMEAGNIFITFLTFIISFLFATWMFQTIERMNQQVSEEKTKQAVYEERERLARELHDNIAQSLFFLNVKLKQGALDEVKLAVNEIDTNLRQAIFNLRSTPNDTLGYFPHRLKKWLEEWSVVTGIDVQVKMEIKDESFSPREEVQIFGIVQEAFTNIRKHSQATESVFRLVSGEEGWQLSIKDNGIGFQNAGSGNKHFGLAMMKERAKKLEATIEVLSSSGEGTEWLVKGEKKGRAKDDVSSANSR